MAYYRAIGAIWAARHILDFLLFMNFVNFRKQVYLIIVVVGIVHTTSVI
jgi:hypothetical protein